MKKLAKTQSLYVTLGIIIISTVAIIISVQSAYTYSTTKNKIIEDIKKSSTATIVSLKKNVADFVASYSVNEYEKLIKNEIETRDAYAIVVEDYNMTKILGGEKFVTGKIRNQDWEVVDYDPDNILHNKQLEECYYSDSYDITSSSGAKLGVISICISDRSMNRELNNIITGTIINGTAISLLLILSLFITIRIFVLKPVSNIIEAIRNSDDTGIPLSKIPSHGSSEVHALATTMNTMISSIKNSRVLLNEQHKELLENEDKLRTLSMATEQSPVSILICSPDNVIEYVNPQFEKTSGFLSSEVVGRTIEFLFEQREQDREKVKSLRDMLESGLTWIGEITPLTRSNENYTIRMSASPIKLTDGSVTHNVYVAEDITEHIKNESMLRNSQKMDAVGQLTGGIAHDFNNLLGIIMGNLELLKLDFKSRPEIIDRIDQALAGTVRGAQLTRKLLNFSRQDNHVKEVTNVNPLLQNMHDLIAKSVTSSIKVDTRLAEKLWSVEIDPGDFEDAILNLSLNARDAMPSGGELVIETANKQLDSDFVNKYPTASAGDFVMISVCDNGSGISEDLRKKIFDPFFTTKEFGKGSGLGLSMVYGFVQRSGGHIQLDSEIEKGTVFRIFLPRVKSANEDEVKEDEQELSGGDETILIVDDEYNLVDMAKVYLNRLGYKTRLAYNAEEALEILSTTNDIDLVFSDVVMPDMDGYELAITSLKKWPAIKVLLTSGFSSRRSESMQLNQKLAEEISADLLEKPYNMKELAIAIRNCLDDKQ